MNKRIAKIELELNNLNILEVYNLTQADINTHYININFANDITLDNYCLLVFFQTTYPKESVMVEEIRNLTQENQEIKIPNVLLNNPGRLNIEFALKSIENDDLITVNKRLVLNIISTINGTNIDAIIGEELNTTISEQIKYIEELLSGAEETIQQTIEDYLNEHGEELKGDDGKSAYQIAQENGFQGTEEEWLESLKGQDGKNGIDGQNGKDGQDGKNGTNGITFTPTVSPEGIISWSNNGNLPNPSPINIKGRDGEDGLDGIDAEISSVSAIVDDTSENPQVNVELGGTPTNRTIAFKFTGINGRNGQNGENGKDGNPGRDGVDGKSAEITSVTAKANSVQGQPTVEVIEGGTNLAKTLQFIFGIPINSEGGSGGTTITDVVVNVDDGVGTPSGTASIKGTTLTLNFSNLKGVQGNNGEQGIPGKDGINGVDGVGIKDIKFKETAEEGNIYTITLTNETSYEFIAPKGKQGIEGQQGIPGQDGKDGTTIESVVVNIDNNVGIPNGTASISGTELTLILKNLKGEQGQKGDTGNQGERGLQGKKGDNGITFTPNVDAEGNLSWTNNGSLENPQSVNIKGPKGDIGPQGIKGDKGDSGPQGERGEQGLQGPKGERGEQGPTWNGGEVNNVTVNGTFILNGYTITIEG